MRKIKLILIIIIATSLISVVPVSLVAYGASYGTTTYFTDEPDEKPPVSQPVYDVGLRSGNKDKKNSNDKNNTGSNGGSESGGGSLFDQIVSGIDSLFGNGAITEDSPTTKKSLFDFQNNSNEDSRDNGEGEGGQFIMGPRGESYENMDEEEIAKYNSRLAKKFDFKDSSQKSVPKQSKLIFTNIIIPVDLTTQYVLIILTTFIALGSSVGYYFWKQEQDKKGKRRKQEDYD